MGTEQSQNVVDYAPAGSPTAPTGGSTRDLFFGWLFSVQSVLAVVGLLATATHLLAEDRSSYWFALTSFGSPLHCLSIAFWPSIALAIWVDRTRYRSNNNLRVLPRGNGLVLVPLAFVSLLSMQYGRGRWIEAELWMALCFIQAASLLTLIVEFWCIPALKGKRLRTVLSIVLVSLMTVAAQSCPHTRVVVLWGIPVWYEGKACNNRQLYRWLPEIIAGNEP